MTELKFKYYEGYCDARDGSEYCEQCHSEYAEGVGCRLFKGEEIIKKDGVVRVPYGNCLNAKYKLKHKGKSVKNFECEYDERKQEIILTIGNAVYECEELYIDGVKAYAER